MGIRSPVVDTVVAMVSVVAGATAAVVAVMLVAVIVTAVVISVLSVLVGTLTVSHDERNSDDIIAIKQIILFNANHPQKT